MNLLPGRNVIMSKHVRTHCINSAVVVLIGVLGATVSEAATYHVAKTGGAGVSCATAQNWASNSANAKLTIAGGIGCLSSGDTLIIHAGTYDESVVSGLTVNIPNGSVGAPTTIQNYPGDVVWLKPSSGSIVVYLTDQSYLTFDGINIDAIGPLGVTPPARTNNTQAFCWKTTYSVDFSTASHHIIYKNAECKNAVVGIQDGGTFNQYINLHIHDMVGPPLSYMGGNGGGYGFYYAGADGLIDGAHIHDTYAYGVHQYNYNGGSSRNVVRNSYVHNNCTGMGCAAILIGSGDSDIAYNNVISGFGLSTQGGIQCGFGGATNCQAYNNTIYNVSIGLDAYNTTNALFKNNIIVNSPTPIRIQASATATCSNNIGPTSGCSGNSGVDPLFVNAAAGDFRLSSSSPAKDAGATIGFVTVDKDGVPRPQGSAYDIGAHEYTVTSSSSLPPPLNLRVVP
jgi:hypothetical protein